MQRSANALIAADTIPNLFVFMVLFFPESAKHLAPFQLPSLETSSGIGFSTEPETRIQRHVIFEKCALGITCKGGRDQDRVREGDKQGGSPSGRLAVGLSHHKLAPGHGWYRRVVPA